MKLRLFVLSSLILPAALAGAQTERVTVRLAPAPNQTLHLRTTQDMAMTSEADVAAGDARSVPTLVNLHTVVDTTSAVGPSGNDGHYDAIMTIDTISVTATMNGRELPLPPQATDAAKQAITFSYDENGKVINVSTGETGDSTNAAMDAARQILMRAFATVAPMTLSVGESVTVPTALNLPLPGGGPAVPMGIEGETRYTLTSVTFEGADRIAHLTSHVTSTMSQGPSSVPTGSPVAIDMTMTGDGKSDVNVDRGIVLHVEQQATVDASMRGPSTDQKMPKVRMHGTFTIVSDLVK